MKRVTDPLTINNLALRNRLVLPPLTTNAAAPGGLVSEAVLDFYRRRAPALGLVVVEAAAIRPDGRLVENSLGLWDDAQLPGMARLAEAIRAEGAAVVIQLNHAGARCVPDEGSLAGASPSGMQFRSDIQAQALNENQVLELTDAFAAAAGRAVETGFDGVEIHGAHFYLLSQFISPFTNHRKDSFGGDIANRARFPLAVVEAVRKVIGTGQSMVFRLNAVEQVIGDAVTADTRQFSRLLASAGVDLLSVSFAGPAVRQESDSGFWQLVMSSALGRDSKAGANIGHAAALKMASGLPVIAVGKLWTEAAINAALENEHVDLIAVGRQIIADPAAAAKIISGRYNEIKPCRECFGCFSTIRRGEEMRCAQW